MQKLHDDATEILGKSINVGERQALIKSAIKYIENKEYNLALNDLDLVLNTYDQTDIDALRQRAIVYTKLNEHSRAITDLNALIILQPSLMEAHQLRGVSHGKIGDYSSALCDINAAMSLSPGNSDLLRQRGLVFGHLQEYDRASSDLSEAVRLDPANAAALRDRGCIKIHMNHYEQAVSDLSDAIKLCPQDIEAIQTRSIAFYRLQQYENAIADSLHVLKLNPHNADAQLDTAKAYLRLGQRNQAVPFLVDAVKEKPAHANTVKALILQTLETAASTNKHTFDSVPVSTEAIRTAERQSSERVANDSFKDSYSVLRDQGDSSRQYYSNSKSSDNNIRAEKAGDTGVSDDNNGLKTHTSKMKELNEQQELAEKAEKKRKAKLKQMLASRRLKEFRNRGDGANSKAGDTVESNENQTEFAKDKGVEAPNANPMAYSDEAVESLVRTRRAVAAMEVDRRAEQAVRLKRDLDENFARASSKEHALKDLVDVEVTGWHTRVKALVARQLRSRIDRDIHMFRTLIRELPKILPLPAINVICEDCTQSNVEPKRAFRKIALELHPDKIKSNMTVRQRLIARSVWCLIGDAYSNISGDK